MPILNISQVYSFSSEDPAWPAANLLSKTAKKWRCRAAGEQTAHVCLELDKPALITGIDIGNEHSAHVSVLVGRRGARDDDFEEILLATTFMSSAESRNGTSFNRVRCFHNEALIKSVADRRWELVKVICTQPYSKQVPFGLAFVKVHAAPDADAVPAPLKPLVPAAFLPAATAAAAAQTSAASPFAKFRMRNDSSESDEASSSLFQRWKNAKETSLAGQSSAGAIRDASPAAAAAAPSARFTPRVSAKKPTSPVPMAVDDDDQTAAGAKAPERRDRNRRAIMYDSDDELPNDRLDKKLEHDRLARERIAASARKKPATVADANTSRSRASERSSDKFQDFLADDSGASAPRPAAAPAVKALPTPLPKTPAAKPNGQRFSPIAGVTAAAAASRKRTLSPSAAGPSSRTETPPKKNRTEEAVASRPVEYKPFRRLLEGVVLVISGIQNPGRAHIRDKALEMGAKYKPDWGHGCTHLICAFANTPKYKQVQGHGKIIKKEWIASCYDQKKRIPWRRFALDTAEQTHPESEDEILDMAGKPAVVAEALPAPTIAPVAMVVSDDEDAVADPRYSAKSEYATGDQTPEKNAVLSSGSDTEDELDRVRERQKLATAAVAAAADSDSDNPQIDPSLRLKPPQRCNVADDDIYNKTTDDERRATPSLSNVASISPLPEFYASKRFYLSSNLSDIDVQKLRCYVTAYGGNVIRNAAEADYIVSNKAKQLSAEFGGEVVRPLWVFECNDMEVLLPTKRYKFD